MASNDRAKIAELFVAIAADMRPLTAGLRAVRSMLAATAKATVSVFARAGKQAASAFTGGFMAVAHLLSGKLALIAGAGGVAGVGMLFGKTILAASDLNETVNKVRTTFNKATAAVTAGADEMARRFGVPQKEFLDAASAIGLIGKGAKLTDAAAAKLGVDLAKVGADASSFYNVPLDVALEKIRAGLVGESEPLRAFGVMLNEDAVKAEALRLKLVGSAKEMTEGTKVQARASLILTGLATATGDLERTQDGLANKLREIRGRFENLAASIGQYFLPAAEAAGKAIAEFAGTLEGRLAANSGIFQSWGDQLKKAADFAGLILRNFEKFKKLAPLVWEDLGKRFQEVFGTLASNLLKVGDYFAQKIEQAITIAMNNMMVKIQDALGRDFGFREQGMNPFAVKRPQLDAVPAHQMDPALERGVREAVAADAMRQMGKEAVGFVGKMFGAMEQLTAKERAAKEADLELQRGAARQRAEIEDNAARRAKKAFTDTMNIFGNRMVKPGASMKMDRAAATLNEAEAKLNAAARGKGPEAADAKQKLEDLKKGRKNLLSGAGETAGLGQTATLDQFYRQVQENIFGKGDDGKKTAEATQRSADYLFELLTGGVKVKGNVPGVAT